MKCYLIVSAEEGGLQPSDEKCQDQGEQQHDAGGQKKFAADAAFVMRLRVFPAVAQFGILAFEILGGQDLLGPFEAVSDVVEKTQMHGQFEERGDKEGHPGKEKEIAGQFCDALAFLGDQNADEAYAEADDQSFFELFEIHSVIPGKPRDSFPAAFAADFCSL